MIRVKKSIIIGIFCFLTCAAGIITIIHTYVTKASPLVNASDTVSAVWVTKLNANANAGDTIIHVLDGTGITIGDHIFINDGVNDETRTAVSSMNNIVTIDNLVNNYNAAAGDVYVTVLTGVKHSFQFDTGSTKAIEKIRFQFLDDAVNDDASFSNITFSNISGVLEAALPNHSINNNFVEFDADGSIIPAGTNITLDFNNVKNPNGMTMNSYGILMETIDNEDKVVDSVTVFFGVDSGVIVRARIGTFLEVTIEDNGTKNNSSDSSTGAEISLGYANLSVLDDPATGYGVDGNKLTVSTNAENGYNISISDNQFGLMGAGFTGTGRLNVPDDDRIDDFSGLATTWPAQGVESYGYSVGNSFDSVGIAGNYRAFTEGSFIIRDTQNPIVNEETFVTVRVQITKDTPVGSYSDKIVYTVVTNI